MGTFKNILVGVLIVSWAYYSIVYLEQDNPLRVLFPILVFVFYIFNLYMRTSLASKNYFTSPFNIFTSNIRSQKSYDVPKELMFEKVIEVINNSDFKLAETNKEKFEILATSSMSFKSHGENLYISFDSEGNNSIMKFCSSTILGISSWGKNKKNCEDLIHEIESSFTI